MVPLHLHVLPIPTIGIIQLLMSIACADDARRCPKPKDDRWELEAWNIPKKDVGKVFCALLGMPVTRQPDPIIRHLVTKAEG